MVQLPWVTPAQPSLTLVLVETRLPAAAIAAPARPPHPTYQTQPWHGLLLLGAVLLLPFPC